MQSQEFKLFVAILLRLYLESALHKNPRLHFVMKPGIFMCAPYQVVVS